MIEIVKILYGIGIVVILLQLLSDIFIPILYKKILKLELLDFHITNYFSVKLACSILVNKKIYISIPISKINKRYMYIEPHYELKIIKKLNKFNKFKLSRGTYSDIQKIINFPFKRDIVFFAHTPMDLVTIFSHFDLPANIELLGPYLSKTPPEKSIKINGKQSFWYVYLIIKNPT